MILVRNIFQAKFGQAGDAARMMAQMMGQNVPQLAGVQPGRWRILTDLTSGPFDTVVMEQEFASLADYETWRAAMFASPEFQQAQEGESPFLGGRAELFTIEAEGGA